MAETRCPQCAGLKGLPKIIDVNGTMKECSDPFHSEAIKAEDVVKAEDLVLHAHPAVTRPTPPVDLNPPEQPDAKCPHCDAAPIEVFFNEIKFPDGRKAYIFYCIKCHNVVPVALQPIVMQRTPAPPPNRPVA